MYIGLGSSFHDPSIAIIDEDGKILFAEGTERYLQNKRALGSIPDNYIHAKDLLEEYCTEKTDFIISKSWRNRHVHKFLWKYITGYMKLENFIAKRLSVNIPPTIFTYYDIPWMQLKTISSNIHAGTGFKKAITIMHPESSVKIENHDHHSTHAIYACYSSPFDEGICAIVDGNGEGGSYSVFEYKNNKVKKLYKSRGFSSIGYMYTLITNLCGFEADKGEQWKLMGLAPYGKKNEVYYNIFKTFLTVEDHRFKRASFRKWRDTLIALSQYQVKKGQSPLDAADLAYNIQLVVSEILQTFLNGVYRLGNSDNLIYSGGVALNSAFNGSILDNTPFKKLYIPSAPGDDGNAIGAALISREKQKPGSETFLQKKGYSPYLGSVISQKSIDRWLKYSKFKKVRHLPSEVHVEAAKLLSEGKIIGWIQGRAEFGPRALGNRSILADPRNPEMKKKINANVKFREMFRPFAPSILHEYGEEYFENYQESPFMERTLKFKTEVKDRVPAVVHHNQTGRLQSVKKEWSAKFHLLLTEFHRLTNIPLVLNTSYNVMGKPIAHSMEDAMSVFLSTGLEALVIEDYIFEK
jgi:carbamoyltransferase